MKQAAADGSPSLSDNARRTLMDTVRQLTLERVFHRATLKVAKRIAERPSAWREPPTWFQPPFGQAYALQGEMATEVGTECATVYLYSQLGEQVVETSCTCRQHRCIHSAALLIRLQQLLDWPRAMTALERWERGLSKLTHTPRSATGVQHNFACLLQTGVMPGGSIPSLILQPVVGIESSRGQWRWIPAEKSKEPLSRQAEIWMAQLSRMRRPTGSVRRGGYIINGQIGSQLLEELLKAGMCRAALNHQAIVIGEDRDLVWRWHHDDAGCAVLELNCEQQLHLFELDGLWYLDELSGACGKVAFSPAALTKLRAMPPIQPQEVERHRERWPPHEDIQTVPPPPGPPCMETVKAPLQRILSIHATWDEAAGQHWFYFEPWADYAGWRYPLGSNAYLESVVIRRRNQYARLHRQPDDEALSLLSLHQAGFRTFADFPEAKHCRPRPGENALAHATLHAGAVDAFCALDTELQLFAANDWTIEYSPDLPLSILQPRLTLHFNPGERPGMTLFELAADIDGETLDVLGIVMKGLATRAFSLSPPTGESSTASWLAPIGPGRAIRLPIAQLREWLIPLTVLLKQVSDTTQGGTELTRAQTLALVHDATRSGVAISGARAAEITDEVRALQSAQTTEATDIPETFCGMLRGYQLKGLHWLQTVREGGLGGVLADDMGLGKTVQIIAHMLLEKERGRLTYPALVVAPTSLIFNWLDEFKRFAPSLRCHIFSSSNHLSEAQGEVDVYLSSYARISIDASSLESRTYSALVLDEAQWIKNPTTQTARAIRRIRAEHRIALTGTPLENHLGELWAHFDVVLPGYLGDARAFQRQFRTPIERRADEQRRHILRQRIAPFLLRRNKESVTPELPAKIESTLRIPMGDQQRKLYESIRLAQSALVREALSRYTEEKARIVALSALLRLRQVCCHPALLPHEHDVVESAKLEALLELVRVLRDESRHILIFSQFTSMLSLIGRALDEAGLTHTVLTGETVNRQAPVDAFQSGTAPILLASLKAGGVGLNLTRADAVVHYDPWWNPAVERQAIDRAHRIGRDAPVLVFKLICEDTIEEKVESMKDDKGHLADAILGDMENVAPLSKASLQMLFDLPTDTSTPRNQRNHHAH